MDEKRVEQSESERAKELKARLIAKFPGSGGFIFEDLGEMGGNKSREYFLASEEQPREDVADSTKDVR